MSTKPPPITKTITGHVQGRWQDEEKIAVFKGIPYAKPPVGDLRWRPPQPAEPWDGVRETTKFGPFAPQYKPMVDGFIQLLIDGHGSHWLWKLTLKFFMMIIPFPKQSEDCLYLNVRTPDLDSGAKLPVMVWIHGGDHQAGSSGEPVYNSNKLPSHDVVVVSINYRLGLFGYLAHPELSAESEHNVSGNYGTLDQIAALQWVQDNITHFGGDPDNVTIFGESAGGESVAHMLVSPLARGLFHRAIMQSPANGGQMRHLRQPFLHFESDEEQGVYYAEKMVGVHGDNQIEQLRQKRFQELITITYQDYYWGMFYPTVDGYVIPQTPIQAFAEGNQAQVPLIVGSNWDEGTVIYPMFEAPLAEYRMFDLEPNSMPNYIQEVYGEDTPQLLQLYPGLEKREFFAESDLIGDTMFGARARFYAEQVALQGLPTYFYMFGRVPTGKNQTIGAFHAAELAFVHGTNSPIIPVAENEKELSRKMMRYWTNFAKAENPNDGGLAEWETFDPAEPRWMYFNTDRVEMEESRREVQYGLHRKRLIDVFLAKLGTERVANKQGDRYRFLRPSD